MAKKHIIKRFKVKSLEERDSDTLYFNFWYRKTRHDGVLDRWRKKATLVSKLDVDNKNMIDIISNCVNN